MRSNGWGLGSKCPPADLALIAVAAIWGLTFPIVRCTVTRVSALQFLQLRFLCASAALMPVALLRARPRALFDPRALAPGLCLAAGYWLQTEGLRSVGASASAFLTGTSVVIVPFLAQVLGWERAGVRRWTAALLALLGVCAVQGWLPSRWSAGEAWTFLCAVAFAAQILLLSRLAPRGGDPLVLGAGQVLSATLLLFIVGAFRGEIAVGHAIPGGIAAAAVFTGLAATAAALAVQTWAQSRVPAGHVAVCFATEPVFAAFYSVGFCGDRLSPLGWLGCVLVVVATLLVATERNAYASRAPSGPVRRTCPRGASR